MPCRVQGFVKDRRTPVGSFPAACVEPLEDGAQSPVRGHTVRASFDMRCAPRGRGVARKPRRRAVAAQACFGCGLTWVGGLARCCAWLLCGVECAVTPLLASSWMWLHLTPRDALPLHVGVWFTAVTIYHTVGRSVCGGAAACAGCVPVTALSVIGWSASRVYSDFDIEAMSASRGRSFSLRAEEVIKSVVVPSAERVLLTSGDKPKLASLYQVTTVTDRRTETMNRRYRDVCELDAQLRLLFQGQVFPEVTDLRQVELMRSKKTAKVRGNHGPVARVVADGMGVWVPAWLCLCVRQ